jgi:glutathione reductase (NADPH)
VEKYDLVVLGTGTAGSGVATRCAAARWRVAIVESREPGGTCALRGCDPKKVLLGAAEAKVGLLETEARSGRLDIDVRSGDMSSWYTSRRLAEPVAAFKTITDSRTGRLLGAHLLSGHASETINLFALAMRAGLTATDMKRMIFAYPTAGSDVVYML